MLLFSNKLFSYFIPRDDGKLPLAGFLAEGKMATYKLILCKTPSSKMDFWLQISFFVVKFSFPKSKQVWLRIVNMEHNIMCHADVSRAKTTISTHFHFFLQAALRKNVGLAGTLIREQGAVLLTVGLSYVGNDVTRSTLLDTACACSYENLPKYRSYRVSNTTPRLAQPFCALNPDHSSSNF